MAKGPDKSPGKDVNRFMPEARDGEVTVDPEGWVSKLDAFIEQQPEIRGKVVVSDIARPTPGTAGGKAHFTAQLGRGEGRCSQRFIVRHEPPEGVFHEYNMPSMFNILDALQGTDVSAPKPFRLGATGDHLGVPAFIMESHIPNQVDERKSPVGRPGPGRYYGSIHPAITSSRGETGMILPFTFSGIPGIHFGPGEFRHVPRIVKEMGDHVLVVTGVSSLKESGKWDGLAEGLARESIRFSHVTCQGEPSPDFVDQTVCRFRDRGIRVVLAVGGGSVIDAGKAISAMLPQDSSVYEFLEGIGTGTHNGEKIPFVAVPTTSGTGSEATKNAVLSKVGPQGFKKSIRHDRLVPDLAVVDPELVLSCPSEVSAACGMDAFTQLLESYVSTRANPFTDALSTSGISRLKDSLIPACTTGGDSIEARAAMAYAALVSGITLANAGLGIVHGLASPIGGAFSIPHGVVCGTLVGAATRVNIEKIRGQEHGAHVALRKYAEIGALVSGKNYRPEDVDLLCDLLIEKIDTWTETLAIPRLSRYGIRASDLDEIARSAGNKNNPVPLDREEIKNLLLMRL